MNRRPYVDRMQYMTHVQYSAHVVVHMQEQHIPLLASRRLAPRDSLKSLRE
jgi:hypothetical protein